MSFLRPEQPFSLHRSSTDVSNGGLCVILFFVALAVRLILMATYNQETLAQDGCGYHQLAVNLVLGNGYSTQRSPPYEQNFLREPGYPYFLAGVYCLVNQITPVSNIGGYVRDTRSVPEVHPEMVVARIIQNLLDSVTVMLFFLVLNKIVSTRIAFISALIFACHVTYAKYSLNIMRETLCVFLLMVLNLVYLNYLSSHRKWIWTIAIGVMVGILILCLQIHFLLVISFFICSAMLTKRFWQSFFHTLCVCGVAFAITLPHTLDAYQVARNLKVFKTFGSSLTYEIRSYVFLVDAAVHEFGVLTEREWLVEKEILNAPAKEQFEKSFNGYCEERVASIRTKINTSALSRRSIVKVLRCLKNTVFLYKSDFALSSWSESRKRNSTFCVLVGLLFPAIIAGGGLLGVFLYGRKYLFYFFPMLMYVITFYAMASEPRRMIIIQPFLCFFFICFMTKMYDVFKEKARVRTRYGEV